VAVRNPGKIPLNAHVSLKFIELNMSCTTSGLPIGPLENKTFAVHVDSCLAGRPPGSPNRVAFLVTAALEKEKSKL
jgi:hypothetical protein